MREFAPENFWEKLRQEGQEERYQAFLERFLSEKRVAKLRTQFEARSNWVTLLSDNLSQPFNLSAVLRSLDGFGFLDFYVLEEKNPLRLSKDVAVGAEKWIQVHSYRDRATCLEDLRGAGYEILGTTPCTEGSLSLEDWVLKRPTVFVLGQELFGLAPQMLEECDGRVHVPIYGFVESFNVSVTAALFLHSARQQIQRFYPVARLPGSERVYLKWLENHFSHLPSYRRRFWEERGA